MDALEVQQGSRASTARLSEKSGGEGKITTLEMAKDATVENSSLASSKSIKSFHMEDTNSQQEQVVKPENDEPLSAIPVERQEAPKEEEDKKEEEEKKQEEEKKEDPPLKVELPPEEKQNETNASPEPNTHHTPTPVPTPTVDTPRPQSPSEDTRSPVQEPPIESKNVSLQESVNSPEVELSQEEITVDQVTEKAIPTPPKSPDGGHHDDSAISSSSMSPEKLSDSPLEERQQTPVIEVS